MFTTLNCDAKVPVPIVPNLAKQKIFRLGELAQ